MSALMARLPGSRLERSMLYARVGVLGTLAMATWKLALLLVSPSTLLLATGVFNLGMAGSKLLAVSTHRRAVAAGSTAEARLHRFLRAFRAIGAAVAALAALSAVSGLLPSGTTERFDTRTAIAIATVTFVEIAIAIPGVVAARRSRELMLEAVKLVNLAGALVLLPLTQRALLSLDSTADAATYDLLSRSTFGALAAIVGIWMLLRRRPTTAARVAAATGVPAPIEEGTLP